MCVKKNMKAAALIAMDWSLLENIVKWDYV